VVWNELLAKWIDANTARTGDEEETRCYRRSGSRSSK
jgi:hypothetical protein